MKTIWTVCFVSKWVFLYFISYPDTWPQRATGRNWHSFGKMPTAYTHMYWLYDICTDCWPHATSRPAGIWTIIRFLILAAFNSFLQMATTVGKIELLLPGYYNMHVCLISHCRGERWCRSNCDEPWLHEITFSVGKAHHVNWYFSGTEHLHFFLELTESEVLI